MTLLNLPVRRWLLLLLALLLFLRGSDALKAEVEISASGAPRYVDMNMVRRERGKDLDKADSDADQEEMLDSDVDREQLLDEDADYQDDASLDDSADSSPRTWRPTGPRPAQAKEEEDYVEEVRAPSKELQSHQLPDDEEEEEVEPEEVRLVEREPPARHVEHSFSSRRELQQQMDDSEDDDTSAPRALEESDAEQEGPPHHPRRRHNPPHDVEEDRAETGAPPALEESGAGKEEPLHNHPRRRRDPPHDVEDDHDDARATPVLEELDAEKKEFSHLPRRQSHTRHDVEEEEEEARAEDDPDAYMLLAQREKQVRLQQIQAQVYARETERILQDLLEKEAPNDPEGLIWNGEEPSLPQPPHHSKVDQLTFDDITVVHKYHQGHHDHRHQGQAHHRNHHASHQSNESGNVITITEGPAAVTEVPPTDPQGVETQGEEPIKPIHAVERAKEETAKAKEAADKAQEFASQANTENVVSERIKSWCKAMGTPEMRKEMEGDPHRKCEFIKLCEGGQHADWCKCMVGFGLTGGPKCKDFVPSLSSHNNTAAAAPVNETVAVAAVPVTTTPLLEVANATV